jgi:DNA-directed RNA polymerase specialized sigma24 family protein
VRVIRSPWRRVAGWSPEEAAAELHTRRVELIGQLRCRSEARGVPPAAQEEIVDDAITAVVMSPRGVANEHHLLGAFWLAVDHRCRRHREGRHFTRLGSRQRVEFDAAAQHATAASNPFDRLELRDRFARAADLMADLDPRERQVLAVMACYGVGSVPAARHLGLPLGEVRSAVRSANAKLDRVAAIAAAGRMCEFRYNAIAAEAAGEASDHDARLARAHVSACVPCGRVYRKLRREMRGRDFQRAAAAAFLPGPAVAVAHGSWLDRLFVWAGQRTGAPRVPSERAAEVLGGTGALKAVAVGTAVVVAGAGALHSVTAFPAVHHHHARHRVAMGARTAQATIAPSTVAHTEVPVTPLGATAHRSGRSNVRRSASDDHAAPVPNRASGYLALGGSSGGSSPSSSNESSTPVRATAASVAQSGSTSSGEASPPPAQSGGGTGLSYLGR